MTTAAQTVNKLLEAAVRNTAATGQFNQAIGRMSSAIVENGEPTVLGVADQFAVAIQGIITDLEGSTTMLTMWADKVNDALDLWEFLQSAKAVSKAAS